MSRARWEICDCCQGDGTLDTQGVVDPHAFTDDEFGAYLGGAYDQRCMSCKGAGKVRADAQPVVVLMRDGTRAGFYDQDDASEAAGLAMMGGW